MPEKPKHPCSSELNRFLLNFVPYPKVVAYPAWKFRDLRDEVIDIVQINGYEYSGGDWWLLFKDVLIVVSNRKDIEVVLAA